MILNNIVRLFGIENTVRISEIDGGHINNTFLAECADGGKYVLQSLNRRIFRNPDIVMKNIAKTVGAFDVVHDEKVSVPDFLCTSEGVNFAECDGEIYRMYRYAEFSDNVQDRLYRTGFAFGTFIRVMNAKNLNLEPSICDFHSYSTYFSTLTAAEKNSSLKKIDNSVTARLCSLQDTLEQVFTVDFPTRNIHGDAKISNVIIRDDTSIIIDLDTVMKGYTAIDYGDMIRSVSGTLDFRSVRDITGGFSDGLGGILTDDEIYSMYYGILYVTGELAVRYLIDYVSEDKYFKGRSSADCLVRANELLRQLSIFISEGDEITSIIYKAFNK
jgi:hypothetical protein